MVLKKLCFNYSLKHMLYDFERSILFIFKKRKEAIEINKKLTASNEYFPCLKRVGLMPKLLTNIKKLIIRN